MKKFYILAVALIVILLTGCGKIQTLECSKTYNKEGMMMHQVMRTKMEGIKATYMDITMDIKFDESYLSLVSIDTLEERFKEQYNSQYGKEGITINYTKGENNILIDIIFDLENISEEDKTSLDLNDVYGTVEATKKEMENQGYTCSIK